MSEVGYLRVVGKDEEVPLDLPDFHAIATAVGSIIVENDDVVCVGPRLVLVSSDRVSHTRADALEALCGDRERVELTLMDANRYAQCNCCGYMHKLTGSQRKDYQRGQAVTILCDGTGADGDQPPCNGFGIIQQPKKTV